jgi:hypothetical protein
MSNIEDIMYEAYRLGITDDVFDEVEKLKNKEENRYCTPYDLYDRALYNILNKKKVKVEILNYDE